MTKKSGSRDTASLGAYLDQHNVDLQCYGALGLDLCLATSFLSDVQLYSATQLCMSSESSSVRKRNAPFSYSGFLA